MLIVHPVVITRQWASYIKKYRNKIMTGEFDGRGKRNASF